LYESHLILMEKMFLHLVYSSSRFEIFPIRGSVPSSICCLGLDSVASHIWILFSGSVFHGIAGLIVGYLKASFLFCAKMSPSRSLVFPQFLHLDLESLGASHFSARLDRLRASVSVRTVGSRAVTRATGLSCSCHPFSLSLLASGFGLRARVLSVLSAARLLLLASRRRPWFWFSTAWVSSLLVLILASGFDPPTCLVSFFGQLQHWLFFTRPSPVLLFSSACRH
jgi:hypothetical protein